MPEANIGIDTLGNQIEWRNARRGGVFECFELTGTIRLEALVEENKSNHAILMVLRHDGKKQPGAGKHNPSTAVFGRFQPPRPGLHANRDACVGRHNIQQQFSA